MPDPSEGWTKHDGVDLPYVEDPTTGEKRFLTALPTPKDHAVKLGNKDWTERGFPTLTVSEIEDRMLDLAKLNAEAEAKLTGRSVTLAISEAVPELSRIQTSVPILDQDGVGACLPHAWASACMIAKTLAGDPFLDLDPFFLYTLINGGRDAGSNAGDAVQALQATGICPRGIVPYGTVRPRGYNQVAMEAAAHCKLRDAVEIKGYEQFLTAILYGWTVCFDVQAGGRFVTDKDGVCGYLGGWNNHEVLAAEEIKKINGKLLPGGRNSWNTTWGVKGRCYWQDRHCDASQTSFAVRYIFGDPSDHTIPTLPGF